MYEYKVVSMPTQLKPKDNRTLDEELLFYLNETINNYAKEGWEFYKSDSFTVSEPAGCLAILAGRYQGQVLNHRVLVFRKEV